MEGEIESELKAKNVNKNEQNETGVVNDNENFKFTDGITLEFIRQLQETFANERDWRQYHTPRNLLLALTGEVGELAEIFQWKSDEKCTNIVNWPTKEREHLGQELSDILLYLIRLADICKIDLPAAVSEKIKINAIKYPVSEVYGSSEKYTQIRKK